MVILRSFTQDDWPVLKQHQYPGMTEVECKKLISEFRSGSYNGNPVYILAVQSGDTIVGYVSLLGQSDQAASEGIEIYIPYRRNGYGYHALNLLFDFAKQHGYLAITAQIRKDNEASLALHHKLGFEILSEFINKRGNTVFSLEKSLQ